MRFLRAGATLAAVICLISLTGCAPVSDPRVTRLPSDGPAALPSASSSPAPSPTAPSPTPSTPSSASESAPPAPDGTDCDGRPQVLSAGSPALQLTGECPEVQVQGSDLAVDAATARIAILLVQGDRVALTLGTGGQVTVQGNDVELRADEISMLVIRGDRNVVTAEAVTGVQFQGNDNVVRAPVSQLDDQGMRNVVG
jgi:hypothetical protein